jgi:hypothetical protein
MNNKTEKWSKFKHHLSEIFSPHQRTLMLKWRNKEGTKYSLIERFIWALILGSKK